MPSPTPLPTPPGGLVYQLEEGEIAHSDDNSLASLDPGVDVSDFAARATFTNPFNATLKPFSYGFKFRDSGEFFQAIVITSEGKIRHVQGTPEGLSVTRTIVDSSVKKEGGEQNSLSATVVGSRAWIFVNDEFLQEIPIGGAGTSSDMSLIVELFEESQVFNAKTGLTGVEIRRIAPVLQIASGQLVKSEGEIAATEASLPVRNAIISASFVAPYRAILGDWSVGFQFEEPLSGTTNWLIIRDSKSWKHYRRAGVGGAPVEVTGGTSNSILVEQGDLNEVLVIADSGSYRVFINGVFITGITFGQMDLPAQVSAIAGFAASDQPNGVQTNFEAFEVWSLGG